MAFWAACFLLAVGAVALRVHPPDESNGNVSVAAQEQAGQDDPPIDWERVLLNAKRHAKSAAPRRPEPTQPFVLHLHLNWAHQYKSALFLLEETEICSARNFMLCAVVSDWARVPEATAALSSLRPSATPRAPVSLVDCPANGGNDVWRNLHGALMYVCFSMTLQIAKQVGAEGVLALADDTMVILPWRTMAPYLRTLGTAVMPLAPIVDPDPHTMDMVTDNECEDCDHWMLFPGARKNFRDSLVALGPRERRRLGFSETSWPVEKALGDVMYIPTSQADEFQMYSNHFFKYKVWEEWCLPIMAKLLSGRDWLPQFPVKGRGLFPLERRRRMEMPVVDEEMQRGELSFIHPVKLSEEFPEQRARVAEIYREVFGP